MQPKCRIYSWSRLVIVGWVSFWMLVVPLFHVHPETDQHHGEVGHIHAGTVHSVFSPDLDGEYGNHHHPTDGFGHSMPEHEGFSTYPVQAIEFAEITFPFLIDSTDRKLLKPINSKLLVVDSVGCIAPAPISRFVQCNESPPHQRLVSRSSSARAPPSLLA